MYDRRAVLLDVDDTLYACAPEVAAAIERPRSDVAQAYAAARRAVKERIDGRGSAHSRLLYLAELVHAVGRPDLLGRVRHWERAFWQAFLGAVRLRPRAVVQLMKLEAFDLLRHLDALVVSEEVPLDEPAEAIFRVAIARLGTAPNDDKDGEGFDGLARAMGTA